MDSTESQQEVRRARRKVHYAFARRRSNGILHPAIRIGGKYLQEYGFNIGDEIEVRCENGRILIAKLTPDASAETPKAR